MLPRSQHIRHQPVSVVLNRMAQRLQFRCHDFVGSGDIAQRSQPANPGGRIRYRRGRRFRGTEQRLFAGIQDGVSGQIIDA